MEEIVKEFREILSQFPEHPNPFEYSIPENKMLAATLLIAKYLKDINIHLREGIIGIEKCGN